MVAVGAATSRRLHERVQRPGTEDTGIVMSGGHACGRAVGDERSALILRRDVPHRAYERCVEQRLLAQGDAGEERGPVSWAVPLRLRSGGRLSCQSSRLWRVDDRLASIWRTGVQSIPPSSSLEGGRCCGHQKALRSGKQKDPRRLAAHRAHTAIAGERRVSGGGTPRLIYTS